MIYVILMALGGSLMVSYTRARAEGLGLDCNVGLMQRAERVVLLGLGSLLFGLAWDGLVLDFIIITVAVLTNSHRHSTNRLGLPAWERCPIGVELEREQLSAKGMGSTTMERPEIEGLKAGSGFSSREWERWPPPSSRGWRRCGRGWPDPSGASPR